MVNVPGIYLYCTVWEREYYAVLIVDHERRRDLTQWQYANLCRQVRSNFEKQGYSVHVLGIICTDEPDQMAGFEYEDFKEGAAGDLILKYPDAEESIRDAGLFI